MSERDGYAAGVPCWVATVHGDPGKAVGFYSELFGWQAANVMAPGSPGEYYVCKLGGRDVAAIGSQRGGGEPPVSAWGTYIWVDNTDEAAARVGDAGGSIVTEPFDLGQSGRLAIVTDPARAVFCLWQANEHRGAQVVNEPGAWAMSMLNTHDPEGAKAFYGAVFGWETDSFDMGGGEITLWRMPGYEGGEPEQPVPRDVIGTMMASSGEEPPTWSVDFWVEDADAAAGRAAELGGEVTMPPFDTPVGSTAVLADPEGAAFSVSRVSA